jgi:hypothetical protein
MINELLIKESPKCNYILILQTNCRLLEGPFIAVCKSGLSYFVMSCVEKHLEGKLTNIFSGGIFFSACVLLHFIKHMDKFI